MKRFRNITSIVTILLLAGSLLASSTLLAVGLLGSSIRSKPASVLLQEGLYAEEIEGDLDAAIKIYEQVIARAKAAEQTAAQATHRLGMCYLKKGKKQKAAEQFHNLVSKFPQQEPLVAKAREQLAKLRPPVISAATLEQGLIAHWKFDEGRGSTAYDSAGSNDGTIHGAQWTGGRVNGALYFDSRDDYVSISPVVLSTNWTVSVWCQPLRNEVGGCNPIMGGPEDYDNYIILCEAKHHINLETDTEGDWVIVGRGVVDFNEWAHYTVTRNGNTVSAYKNGVYIDDATLPKGDENTITKIGSGYGAATYYKGKIDDVRIYNRALSEEEIGALYRSAIGSAPDERAPGFGPVKERKINDDAVAANNCIDFDTGQLFSLAWPGSFEKAAAWCARNGIDAMGELDGQSAGLYGVDMAAMPIRNDQWDTIQPDTIRRDLSLGKLVTPAVMSRAERLPTTYIFRTREGGLGVLQILGFPGGEPRGVTIRYKMVQETTEPVVQAAAQRVFLPDADTPGVNAILDLASGELLPAGEGVHQLTVFREMGKGDLAYDRVLICLRGGKAKLLQAGKLTALKIKGQIKDSTAYELPGTPCRLVVTTAEEDNYEVTVMSADDNGAKLEYKKMLAEPAEVAPVPAPAPSYPKGLVGHWKFDEGQGSRARDSAGNYDGTLKGPKWTTGRLGAALEFDGGPEDGVFLQGSVGDRSLLNLGTRNLTISSWVKIRGEGGTIVARARPRVTLYRLGVTTKKAYIDFMSGKQRWVLQTDEILQQDTWYHIVGVFDRSQKRARLYVDGRERATGALTTRSSSGIGESTTIGRWFSARGPTFEGVIDEVMIFNRALSAEEIQELYTEVSGFRPAADVVIADIGDSSKAALYDFDARRLVRIPDPLRNAGSEERHRWIVRKGLDMGAKFAGDEYGLIGVDVVATRIALEQWDKITPAKLRQALAAEPIGVEKGDWGQTVMPAKGEYPPTFAFRTREGGAGVLQIIDADRGKKTIRFRYKMVQARAEPVKISPRKIFLSDADTPGVNAILDLASGELLPAGEGVHQLTVFREMGKGDLAYDRVLICIRGGKAKLLQEGKLTNLEIFSQMEDSTAYKLPKTPCRLVVTTAEGDAYEVKVLSVEGDKAGIHIEYWKSAEAPAEFATATAVQPDIAKAIGLGEAMHGLFEGIYEAVESNDPNTALIFVDMLSEPTKQYEALIKGTAVEPMVKSGLEVLAQLREALANKDIDRAKSLLDVIGQIGPAVEEALKRAGEQQGRQNSAQKLSGLGKAVVMYANDHNGKMPATLQELKPYLGEDFQWFLDNVVYLGKGKTAADAPDTVIAYDRTLLGDGNGTNVLFVDTHVEFLTPEELKRPVKFPKRR